MKPKDGTPPFCVNASDYDRYWEYDSDENYTTDIRALSDFDLHTREQRLEPQHLPDTRFLLTSHRPLEEVTRLRGFIVGGADTII
jgi:hypothetical protein